MICSVLRQMRRSKRVCYCISNVSKRRYCAAGVDPSNYEAVIIPTYIPRSKTDILKALETTIKRDPTSPHFKFHDDPYLYPMSSYKKRVYALAQESGRKAADWIKHEHRELFLYSVSDPPLRKLTPYQNADPPINAYIPRAVYTEESNVCEEDLKIVIKNNLVSDAILVYNLLKSKNPDAISKETEQHFLELLCYYNETDPVPIEWVEEKWFSQSGPINNQRGVKWKNEGLATRIFSDMTEKTPAAYCAMIAGQCKHYQANMAYKLYEECLQNEVPLNTDVYNGLFSVVGFLKESSEMQWDLIKTLMLEMNAKGLTPNLGTFNSILETISLMNGDLIRDYALQIFSEMVQKCKIEPSLATWYFMLGTFYKDKTPNNNLLYQIMGNLEEKSLEIKDPKDVFFFMTAMNLCRYKLRDVKLAHRIHSLLMKGSNYDLIGDSFRENIYYRNYFTLLAQSIPLDAFMEFYNSLVPHVYVPETSVMNEVIRAIDANGSNEHYPLIWSHLIMFGLSVHQPLLQSLLEAMVRNISPETVKEDEAVGTQDKKSSEKPKKSEKSIESLSLISEENKFANIAWEIFNKIDERVNSGRVEKLGWNATMLNDIVLLLSRAERYDDAFKAVQVLSKSGGSIGVPQSSDALSYFARGAVKNGSPSYAAAALAYLSECGFSDSADISMELLQKLLNRTSEEVKELAEQVAAKNTSAWSSDATLSKLLSIANHEITPQKSQKKWSKNKSDTSSDSSDSDSDSDNEENYKLK